jgi:hypothetical protein
MRFTYWFEELRDDVTFALRQLRRSPGFTFIAAITLALGIGANSAIFARVDATLLRPLPFPHPERLVMVSERTERSIRAGVSPLNLLDWNERNRTFEVSATTQPPARVQRPDGECVNSSTFSSGVCARRVITGYSASFVAECLDGVDPDGAANRNVTRDQANRAEQRHSAAEGNRIERRDAEQEPHEQASARGGERQTYEGADRDERHPFTQHHGNHIASLCSKRHPDTDLARPACHRVRRDAVNADGREQKAHGPDSGSNARGDPKLQMNRPAPVGEPRRRHDGEVRVQRRHCITNLARQPVVAGTTGHDRDMPFVMLLEGEIDCRRRPRGTSLEISRYANHRQLNGFEFRRGACARSRRDEPRRLVPDDMTADRILSRPEPPRCDFTDDRNELSPAAIGRGEVATRQQSNPER